MKILIIDKSKREDEPQEPRYAVKRLQETLDARNIPHDFCEYKDISLEVKDGVLTVFAAGNDLKNYTHILPRGHRPQEYQLKRTLARYGKASGIYVQNAEFIEFVTCYDKLFQMEVLAKEGLPYLDSFYTLDGQYHKQTDAINRIGFPLIYKHTEGAYRIEKIDGVDKFKKNVFLINNLEELEKHCTTQDQPDKFFIQRFADIGEDFRALYIGSKFYGGFKRAATRNFMTVSKGQYTAYDNPPPEFLELCDKTATLFRAEYCAIDIIYEGGKPYVLEINMDPGFKAFETKIEGKKHDVAGAIIEALTNSKR